MNRKGIHASYMIGTFVLLVLVLLVSSTIFLAIKRAYENTEDDAKCASQIRIHAAAVRATTDLKAPKIVCPSDRIMLDPGRDPKPEIAEAMERCWTMWGKGELQLFGDTEGAYCHVCSLISVPGGEPVTGLPEYLATAKANREQTYTEFLAGVSKGEAFRDETHPDLTDVSLPTDKPLGVVFYYAKGQDFMDSVQNAIIGTPPRATAVGTSVGVVAAVGVIYVASGVLSGGTLFAVSAVALAGGAATGAGAGFITGLTGRADMDTMSVVLVRSMDEEDIRGLGCTYAPAANE